MDKFGPLLHIILFLSYTLSGSAVLQGQVRPRCVASMSIIADMAREIAGEKAEVHSLIPVGSDPHTYEPVPSDVAKVARAQLVFRNGLNLEGWLDELITRSGTSARLVTVTEGIPAVSDPDHPGSFDPHAWMDPVLGKMYAQNIAQGLISLLPSEKNYFQSRLKNYLQKLDETDAEIERLFGQITPDKRMLITSHDAFRYFARRYGWQTASALGTSTDAEVRTGDMKRLANLIREKGVQAVFIESAANPKLIEQVAADNGAVVGGKLFADSIGDSLSGADTYIKMLLHNARTLTAGLTANPKLSALKPGPPSMTAAFWAIIVLFLGGAMGLLLYRLKRSSFSETLKHPFKLQVEGLWVSYEKKTVLANIYASLDSGQVWGMIGPNGSGKSTLFKSILGIIPADAGTVSVSGHSAEAYRTRIAYVPQKDEIDPDFPATAEEIVLTGRYAHLRVGQPLRPEDREAARMAMQRLEISDLSRKKISELSGGQQQRVFIARALCQEADIYLLDEPFVGVDVTTEKRIIDLLHELASEGKLVLVVHHDLAKVPAYFDSVILIHQRIIAIGKTEEVFTSENIARTFEGRSPILDKSDRYL